MPPPVSQEVLASQDENIDPQPPDSSISWEMRSALIKKVILEKRRTNSYRKVDFKRVFELKGTLNCFTCYSMYQGTRSILRLTLRLFFFREKGQRVVVFLPGLHHQAASLRHEGRMRWNEPAARH